MRTRALVLALLLFAACGDPVRVTTGYVVDKDYDRAHWSDNDTSLFGRDWDDKDCDTDWEYQWDTGEYEWEETCKYWYDDRWRLRLKNCYDDPDKCHEGWVEVDEDEYDEFRRGQHYPTPR